MSIFASILRSVYKLSGAKKAFALPEDALRKEIEKQNRHRGVFTPTDRKAYYETIAVNGFPCLRREERRFFAAPSSAFSFCPYPCLLAVRQG